MKLGWVIFGIGWTLSLLYRRIQRHVLGDTPFPPPQPETTMCGVVSNHSLELRCDLMQPSIGDGWVKVKVHYASVNPIDLKIHSIIHMAPSFIFPKPFILGGDVAGVVDDVSEKNNKFKKGDRVYAMLPLILQPWGGYAEYVSVHESHLSIIPNDVDDTIASAAPLAALTAIKLFDAIHTHTPGARMLVNDVSGGIGHLVAQYAMFLGYNVTGTCSRDSMEYVTSLGVHAIDYSTNPIDQINDQFDVVMDLVGMELKTITHLLNASHGHYITPLKTPSDILLAIKMMLLRMISSHSLPKSLHGVLPPVPQLSMITVVPNGHILTSKIGPMLSNGTLTPHIAKTYDISHVSNAHDHVHGVKAGKVIISIASADCPTSETQDSN